MCLPPKKTQIHFRCRFCTFDLDKSLHSSFEREIAIGFSRQHAINFSKHKNVPKRPASCQIDERNLHHLEKQSKDSLKKLTPEGIAQIKRNPHMASH